METLIGQGGESKVKKNTSKRKNKDGKESEDAPDTSKKVSSLTRRLTAADKEELTASGRALFVALPKIITKRRALHQQALHEWILKPLDKSSYRPARVISSGNSFLAVLFETSEKGGGAAKKKLDRSTFKFEGLGIRLVLIYCRPSTESLRASLPMNKKPHMMRS